MKPKKIVLLVTQDHGGAGEYIYKLANLFISQGHQVVMLVSEKTKKDDFIVEYNPNPKKKVNFISKLIRKITKRKDELQLEGKYYFYGLDEITITININMIFDLIGFKPEFIFSGWTANFINSSELLLLQQSSNAKVYTISVDMNHLTGGCHYAWDCKGFINGCSESCPAILSEDFKDKAKINFETKFQNVHLGNFKIISASGWTLKQAMESKIYKNQSFFPNINSMIDTSIMKLVSKEAAKSFFNLKPDKFYILMGCQYGNDPRKGFEYLLESLKILYNELDTIDRTKINVLIVSSKISKSFEEIPFEKTPLEYIKDYKTLSLLYQAVDVFVNSSVEDSGPMMVSEALACGTPVVGFDMGVVHNMVINKFNGYKAKLKDANDLALGIKQIYQLSPEDYSNYSNNAISQIQKYSSIEYGVAVLNEILMQ